MQLAYVILLPDDVHSFMRPITVDLVTRYRLDALNLVLPPHVTIKQPFAAEAVEPSIAYLDVLAETLEPFELSLAGFGFFDVDRGIVFLDVAQDTRLKAIQQRIIEELALEPALYENDSPVPYRFHATIADGLSSEQLAEVRAELGETPEFRFPLERLGLFLYVEGAEWTLYRRVRVGRMHRPRRSGT